MSHTVMELIQEISNAKDNKNHAICVFIDLEAFDTVSGRHKPTYTLHCAFCDKTKNLVHM